MTGGGGAVVLGGAGEQRAARRRVFVATNIAESSVTIRDVGVVIDACRALRVGWDDARARHVPKTVWCSRSAADQRAGRTGRTCAGRVFRLVPRAFYRQLPAHEPAQLLLVGMHAELLKLASARDSEVL